MNHRQVNRGSLTVSSSNERSFESKPPRIDKFMLICITQFAFRKGSLRTIFFKNALETQLEHCLVGFKLDTTFSTHINSSPGVRDTGQRRRHWRNRQITARELGFEESSSHCPLIVYKIDCVRGISNRVVCRASCLMGKNE